MYVLAIDAAGETCSAAIIGDGEPIAVRQQAMRHGHAEALPPMIKEVMSAVGFGFDALHRLAVTCGPGSFTGLRIGLAAARGLALATGLPLVGVASTEVLAAATGPEERIGRHLLAVLDSKRGDVYAQAFDSGLRPLGEAFVLTKEKPLDRLPDGPLLVVGDAADSVIGWLGRKTEITISQAAPTIDPMALARLAEERDPTYPVRPLYIRPPEARRPEHRGQLRP